MKIRAKNSFCGTLCMTQGEVREYDDTVVLQDLLQAGYVEEVKQDAPKGGKKNDDKRDNAKRRN